jgi:hypothetical protein
MKKYLLCLLVALPFLGNAQKSNYTIQKRFAILSTGGWDYLAVYKDQLYVSHGTQVNIVNKNTGDSVGIIEGTTGVHGIAFDPIHETGFTSNGKLNNVFAFNVSNRQVIATIATGENPDAIFYEPFSKCIITCNGRGKNISFIDPVNFKVIATTPVGGKPETAVSDEAGNIFINMEDKNEIVKIDVTTHQVTAHWKIDPVEEPTGLAIDIQSKRLFAGGEKRLAVVDAVNGKLITTLPIGEGCDGVAFDAKKKYILTANGEGTMSVYAQKDPNHYTLVENAVTAPGARTITIDNATGVIYMPTADLEKTSKDAPVVGRPKMIPGTFQILKIQQ